MILVVDNYDSFTFNLVQLLATAGSIGTEVRVVRNDDHDAATLLALSPTHIVLSPGPGDPSRAGVSAALIARSPVPVLGVCLGHQCIAAVYGARVGRAPEPVHGRAHAIAHDGRGVFEGLPQPLVAARYHSLAVAPESVPDCLEATAHTGEGVVMGLRHRSRPLHGVQFHPESVLTPDGARIIQNFLAMR